MLLQQFSASVKLVEYENREKHNAVHKYLFPSDTFSLHS